MMRLYQISIILFSLLTLTACNDFLVGQSIQFGGPNDPQFVINGPDRVNVSQPFDVTVTIDRHTSTKEFAGFEFDLLYSGVSATYNGRAYENFFPGVSQTDYFCVPVDTSVSGEIRQNACAGIGQSNTQALADTYSFTFTASNIGTMDFDVNNEIIANRSLPPSVTGAIQLQTSIAKQIEICLDNDGDGFYTTTCGQGVTDCNDANPLESPGLTEICDGIDNNCGGGTDEAELGVGACAGFAPNVDEINFGLNPIAPNDKLSGQQTLTIDYTDTQDGGVPGDNMDSVTYRLIDGGSNVITLGTSTDKGNNFPVVWNTNVAQTPDGIYTIEAIATDLTGYQGSLSIPVELDNSAICDVSQITWSTNSILEGNFVDISIVGGNNECDGKEFTLSYYENDGGSYTQITDSNILANYPASITFNSAPTFGQTTATAFWFRDDVDDGDRNPEIQVRVIDDEGTTVSSSDLLIINMPPVLTVTNESIQETTVDIIANTPNDASTYTLQYTTTSPGDWQETVTSPSSLETHTFQLSGLSRRTTYYYRVTATDLGEDTAVFDGEFTTAWTTADFTGPGGEPDGFVTILDLVELLSYYRLTTADTGLWDPFYDIAPEGGDGRIDILDLSTAAIAYTG